ncbi:hypothetical protein JQ557_09000 [Bradyrhizobium sp. U87765 SZCCT0131]|uniref:hypothetical protein n=1 Tax=unclassified Bradyrhizobium TaxID=2631580 RepID=UPI001BAC5FB6|nr:MULTISPECIES: hypothetical protein [unclassified Bradyrhizobium]MBR1218121.1 hypothetical protein [Bradyrhizobium sp. U87765 SZCCT0131]MBR1260933.1 hypothetical protein [Bradyrhizobium sp. U87765 SZCCT0134]MBR1303619.1 hypothetical protein [Bradyrhizobium sp. U87765 SZCCT0110]MBR1319225.1 hypothetical protein [Bradyrhizobium sp. U87765 SZCCT0109]MBR1347550.1 hypothetical protein [Bradyrhizobium sp. U87765 SZCCT0048]
MPPLLLVLVGALGGTALVRWGLREARRINDELERVRTAHMAEARVEPVRRLRRDPKTGVYWAE